MTSHFVLPLFLDLSPSLSTAEAVGCLKITREVVRLWTCVWREGDCSVAQHSQRPHRTPAHDTAAEAVPSNAQHLTRILSLNSHIFRWNWDTHIKSLSQGPLSKGRAGLHPAILIITVPGCFVITKVLVSSRRDLQSGPTGHTLFVNSRSPRSFLLLVFVFHFHS